MVWLLCGVQRRRGTSDARSDAGSRFIRYIPCTTRKWTCDGCWFKEADWLIQEPRQKKLLAQW